ncbi:MAG: VCBS repeat-containing protein [Planctomycetes bacterium]|nr:VCBS repeat-containing protein [Planctomycetota bacterium]
MTSRSWSMRPDGMARVRARHLDVGMLVGAIALLVAAWQAPAADVPLTKHAITTAAEDARSVHATDIDGDLDVDVLAASALDDTIAWYENDGTTPPGFTEHVITTSADAAISVHAADLDHDGDVDFVCASYGDDTIAWYENDGATPPGFTEHVVTTTADGAIAVVAAHVDNDGAIDILVASHIDDTIAWYENDGLALPGFTEHVISTTADGARCIHPADLDGDGDVDVLAATVQDATIAWYENDGAAPPAFTRRVIATGVWGAWSVDAADVDGDGDTDALSASWTNDRIAWYENDGSSPPGFTAHLISTTADQARSVHAVDVDRDGDIDVLSASSADDKVAWYENDGAAPPGFTEHVISLTADGAWSVYAADVDDDGDPDVLAASADDDTVAWFEHDGSSPPGFMHHTVSNSADGARSVHTADVDGDGDLDVLSASSIDDTVAWHEAAAPSPCGMAA